MVWVLRVEVRMIELRVEMVWNESAGSSGSKSEETKALGSVFDCWCVVGL